MTHARLYIENWNLLMRYRAYLQTAVLHYKWRRKLEIEIKKLEAVNGIIYRSTALQKELEVDTTFLEVNSKATYENKYNP